MGKIGSVLKASVGEFGPPAQNAIRSVASDDSQANSPVGRVGRRNRKCTQNGGLAVGGLRICRAVRSVTTSNRFLWTGECREAADSAHKRPYVSSGNRWIELQAGGLTADRGRPWRRAGRPGPRRSVIGIFAFVLEMPARASDRRISGRSRCQWRTPASGVAPKSEIVAGRWPMARRAGDQRRRGSRARSGRAGVNTPWYLVRWARAWAPARRAGR